MSRAILGYWKRIFLCSCAFFPIAACFYLELRTHFMLLVTTLGSLCAMRQILLIGKLRVSPLRSHRISQEVKAKEFAWKVTCSSLPGYGYLAVKNTNTKECHMYMLAMWLCILAVRTAYAFGRTKFRYMGSWPFKTNTVFGWSEFWSIRIYLLWPLSFVSFRILAPWIFWPGGLLVLIIYFVFSTFTRVYFAEYSSWFHKNVLAKSNHHWLAQLIHATNKQRSSIPGCTKNSPWCMNRSCD